MESRGTQFTRQGFITQTRQGSVTFYRVQGSATLYCIQGSATLQGALSLHAGQNAHVCSVANVA
eukprot:366137-Chlamydomonas_euryale.AAC.4